MLVRMRLKLNDPVLDTFNIMANIAPVEPWEEEFDSECSCLANEPEGMTARHYAEQVINFFNRTLKYGESPRMLISVEEIK